MCVAVFYKMVTNVLVIIILASFMELLLPEGKLKPFVRFAIGLFILIAILNPSLSFLFNRNHDFNLSFWDYCEQTEKSDRIMEKGQDLSEKILGEKDDLALKKLQGQISAMIMLIPGVKAVETVAQLSDQGVLLRLDLLVTTEEGDKKSEKGLAATNAAMDRQKNEIENKAVNIVKSFYNLEDVDIKIGFTRG